MSDGKVPLVEKELLRAAERLVSNVIVGYENEQSETWPQNMKDHRCKVCYEQARRLRKALAAYQAGRNGK